MSKVTNSNRLLGLHKDMKLKKQMKMMGLSRKNDQRAEDDGAQQNKNDQGDEKGQ
jgi:hypothetical protein